MHLILQILPFPELRAMRPALLLGDCSWAWWFLLCRNLLHRLGVCQSPKEIPSRAHVLISILSFPLILWWKVHASSLTREWCFFLFFLSPCLNFLASLPFLSLYSLPFVSDAEMKIVGCKFLLFCVMSAFCLLFFHFHIFHGMLGLIKTTNHNITAKLWYQGGGDFVSLHTTGFQANLVTVAGESARNIPASVQSVSTKSWQKYIEGRTR